MVISYGFFEVKRMYFRISKFLILVCSLLVTQAYATSYQLQHSTDTIVGKLDTAVVGRDTTLLDIAREYGFGYQDLKLLNPKIDTWMPEDGELVQLPSKFILPNVVREGIVLNIPEMRLYFFPPQKKGEPERVYTYPLGVGREGWATPYKKTRIIGKKEHPDWRPPKSILQEHEDAGDPLPEVVKAGPDNPLGDHALRLGLPAYLIHGTNKPWGIGMRVSHGCIRLYPEDIAELFDQVKVGTAVNIINNPYKIGEEDGVLYLEAHPPLTTATKDEYGNVIESTGEIRNGNFTQVVEMIVASTAEDEYVIDWGMAKIVSEEVKGIPVAIGISIPKQAEKTGKDAQGDRKD
jgi:L,D-transpeptidase ErfK/SrfK